MKPTLLVRSSMRCKPLALALLLAASGPALAVENGVIASGSGSIAHNGATTQINQSSSKLIINWNNFDIANGETVNIAQPNANSAVLNRVTGSQSATSINGALNANGTVFVVNPNGVVFGNTANVHVGSLVASSLNISDDTFNKYSPVNLFMMSRGDSQAGAVVNNGQISATDNVYLVGPEVTNNGNIAGRNVSLMGAETAYLLLDPAKTFNYLGTSYSVGNRTDAHATRVTNNGKIEATQWARLLAVKDNTNIESVINLNGNVSGQRVDLGTNLTDQINVAGNVSGNTISGNSGLGTLTVAQQATLAASSGGINLAARDNIVIDGNLNSDNGRILANSSTGSLTYNGQARANQVALGAYKQVQVGSTANLQAAQRIDLNSRTSSVTTDGTLTAPQINITENGGR